MNEKKWLAITLLVLVQLFVDFFCPTLINSRFELINAVTIGFCMGQLTLIAVWSAFAPGKLVLRLPWSLLLACCMWYALVLGNRVAAPSMSRDDAIFLGVMLAFGVLVTQVPLWISRYVYGWRLLTPQPIDKQIDDGRIDDVDRQFGIRHIFVGMILVSIGLALGRVVLPPGVTDSTFSFESEMWIVLSIAAICNLVVVAPCIWLAYAPLVSRKAAFVIWSVYTLAVSILEYLTLVILMGPPGGNENMLVIGWTLNMTQASLVYATMRLLRRLGFRLIRLPAESPQKAPSG